MTSQPFTCRDKEHHALLRALSIIRNYSPRQWRDIKAIALWDVSKTLVENSDSMGISIHCTKVIASKFHLDYRHIENIQKSKKSYGEWSRRDILEAISELRKLGLKISDLSRIFNRSESWIRNRLAWSAKRKIVKV